MLTTLVDAALLQAHLDDPDWCIVDCRHDLAQPDAGREAYRQAHLPGAVFAHLDRDLSGAHGPGLGRHPLPAREALAERFRAWGINDTTQIVAYDGGGGSYAARLWWLARWLGHEAVALLDGGWSNWLQHGGPQTAVEPVRPRGNFRARPPREPIADAEQVDAWRQDPAKLVVDARAPDRYDGSHETIDRVGGHIPGAINRFWQANLDADGRFKPAAQLRAEFDALLAGRSPAQLAVHCGSGVTACHHLLALRIAGLPGAALYPPSWSGWIDGEARPVARGT